MVYTHFLKTKLFPNEPLSLTPRKTKNFETLDTLFGSRCLHFQMRIVEAPLANHYIHYEVSTLGKGCEIKCEAIGYVLGNKGNLENPSPFKGKRWALLLGAYWVIVRPSNGLHENSILKTSCHHFCPRVNSIPFLIVLKDIKRTLL